jgi:hypothetical protein
MVKFCAKCGRAIDDQDKFCRNCGVDTTESIDYQAYYGEKKIEKDLMKEIKDIKDRIENVIEEVLGVIKAHGEVLGDQTHEELKPTTDIKDRIESVIEEVLGDQAHGEKHEVLGDQAHGEKHEVLGDQAHEELKPMKGTEIIDEPSSQSEEQIVEGLKHEEQLSIEKTHEEQAKQLSIEEVHEEPSIEKTYEEKAKQLSLEEAFGDQINEEKPEVLGEQEQVSEDFHEEKKSEYSESEGPKESEEKLSSLLNIEDNVQDKTVRYLIDKHKKEPVAVEDHAEKTRELSRKIKILPREEIKIKETKEVPRGLYRMYHDAIYKFIPEILDLIENTKEHKIKMKIPDIAKKMGDQFIGKKPETLYAGLKYSLFDHNIVVEMETIKEIDPITNKNMKVLAMRMKDPSDKLPRSIIKRKKGSFAGDIKKHDVGEYELTDFLVS